MYCSECSDESDTHFRPFFDSSPIMERSLAVKAELGWVGKHSLVLNRDRGAWFFLGELLIDLSLPVDKPLPEKCGRWCGLYDYFPKKSDCGTLCHRCASLHFLSYNRTTRGYSKRVSFVNGE